MLAKDGGARSVDEAKDVLSYLRERDLAMISRQQECTRSSNARFTVHANQSSDVKASQRLSDEEVRDAVATMVDSFPLTNLVDW